MYTAYPLRAVTVSLKQTLLSEVLRDAHEYAPGVDSAHPAEVDPLELSWRRRLELVRARAADAVERSAALAGFHRRHFEPDRAAARLAAVLDQVDALERTWDALGDDHSKRLFVDLLKVRVLGPAHVSLPVSAERYRALQASAERRFRSGTETLEVADPFFSRLHMFELPRPSGRTIRLWSHSVSLVNIFELEQYGYARDGHSVVAAAGDVAIDAGGCWGDSALYLADLVGPEGRVYTFEFAPDSLDVLRRNLALNPELAERIVVVEEALWERSGERLTFAPAGQVTSVMRDAGDASLSTTTVTVDDFAEREGIDRVGFLKMDVEGAEPSVLRGAQGCLSEHAPKLAIAAYHRESDLAELPSAVAAARPDYRMLLGHFSPGEDETVLFASTP
jgi:FkbM family methyltransferase